MIFPCIIDAMRSTVNNLNTVGRYLPHRIRHRKELDPGPGTSIGTTAASQVHSWDITFGIARSRIHCFLTVEKLDRREFLDVSPLAAASTAALLRGHTSMCTGMHFLPVICGLRRATAELAILETRRACRVTCLYVSSDVGKSMTKGF